MLNLNKAALTFLSIFILFQTLGFSQSLKEAILQNSITISSHRGVSVLGEEENSILSMTKALTEGILLHEIDIMESKDGKLYLLHDETLDRTTDKKGKIIETDSDILDSAHLNGTKEPLPTFKEALYWAKENGAYLMLDVKSAPVAKVMAEVEELELMDRVMLLTFSRERTKEAISYPKSFLISALIQDKSDIDYFLDLFTGSDFLIGYINKSADTYLYQEVKSAGIPIITDTMGELDKQAHQGDGNTYIDFINSKNPDILVSDYPLLLKKVVNKHF